MKTLSKPLIILIAFVFLLPLAALSQSNYKPGYVVMSKGDTVKGFIDYQEWDICPDTIKFKKTLLGERSLYGVNEIGFFSIENMDEYKRFTVSISNAEVDPNKIEYLKDTTARTATVFLRVLQRGDKVALYAYKDKIKARYYLGTTPDFTPKELTFQTYLNRDYENAHDFQTSRTITENTFQRQLNVVAMNLNELNDKLMQYIHTLQYEQDDMLKIASKLNHIDKAAYEKTRNKKSSYQFLVGAGLNYTCYEPSWLHQYNIDGTYYSSVQPFISAGITLFPGPNTRRLMFRFEVVLSDGTYKAFLPYKVFEASFVPQVLYNIYN